MDADWSSWDLGSARRAIFSNNESVSRRVLRRLHLRWFHANKKAMKRMLKAGGVPPKVLQLVDDVVDTCRVCKLWMKNGTKATTTVKLSIQFNDEGAMASEEVGAALGRMGTTRKLKAPGQHAQIVELHQDILRKQLHLIDAALRECGIKIPFTRRLAKATFAKNAFLNIGEGTPYKALYRRVPLMLRDFDRSGAQEIDDEDGLAMFRYSQRLREIATASIIEATAQARTERAAKARTGPVAEDLQLEVGDLVDFYKQAKAPKDVPNWQGPAKVASASAPETGTITVHRQGRDLIVNVPDVRRAISYSYAVSFMTVDSDPAIILLDFMHNIGEGFEHLGW
ncbi:unnamed protein product, partial [Prorocentrum cordatum]